MEKSKEKDNSVNNGNKNFHFIGIILFLFIGLAVYYTYSINHPAKTDNTQTYNILDAKFSEVNELLYEKKNYAQAYAMLNNEQYSNIKDEKAVVQILLKKAEVCMYMDKKEKAEEFINAALKYNLGNSDKVYSYIILSDIYCEQGRQKEALELIQEIREIEPNIDSLVFKGKFDFYLSEATIYSDKGDYEKAIIASARALELDDTNNELMADYAFALFRNKQIKKAREVANIWLKRQDLNKKNENSRMEVELTEELSKIYLILGEYDKAIACARKTQTMDKCSSTASMEAALIYYYWGKDNEAKTEFKKVIKYWDGRWDKAMAINLLKEIENKEKTKKK